MIKNENYQLFAFRLTNLDILRRLVQYLIIIPAGRKARPLFSCKSEITWLCILDNSAKKIKIYGGVIVVLVNQNMLSKSWEMTQRLSIKQFKIEFKLHFEVINVR